MKRKIKNWTEKHKDYPIRVFAWLPIITNEGFVIWWEYCWKYVWLLPDEYGGTAYKYSSNYEMAKENQVQI
jgi:hypothetical protein